MEKDVKFRKNIKSLQERRAIFYGESLMGVKSDIFSKENRKMDKKDPQKRATAKGNHIMEEGIKYPLKISSRGS